MTATWGASGEPPPQEGDWFQAPYADARRTSGNTNDLRGKVLRIKVKADGSYFSPSGNLFPESQDVNGKTRPEIYAMGFRNPFRIQVDDNDVAVRHADYSPDSNYAGDVPRPGRHRPRRGGPPRRPTTAGRCA